MRKKKNDQAIGDVIDLWLHQNGLSGRYHEFKLLQSWSKLLGPVIANRTEDIFIRDGILHVKLASASLRNELTYSKTKLIDLLNEEAGKQVIHDIQFR